MFLVKLQPYIAAILFFIVNSPCSAQTELHINSESDPKSDYLISMVQLAIDHSGKKYTIKREKGELTEGRIIEDTNAGKLDVMWSSANADIEKILLPIRIPLYKGLIGHRVLLIRKGEQYRFDQIKTLDDLKAFTLGQGATWGDTKILKANGLNVVTTQKYPGLFYMLNGGRFDALPRGVSEAFGEVEQRPQLALEVEKNLLLVYPMPFYLFVKKDNIQLAKDLESGLNAAIQDGSFDKAFFRNPTVQDVIYKANITNRHIIKIDNFMLSKETPLDRKELWLDVKSLSQ